MANKIKISKNDILTSAFEILEKEGINKVTTRDIAKKLNCSIQPIFYQFKSVEELKKKLLEYALKFYQNYLLTFKGEEPKYKQVGINYIKFASIYPNVFKFIFMEDYNIKLSDFAKFDKSYLSAEEVLCKDNHISPQSVKGVHQKMWIFTHGIACLVASHTVTLTDKEISKFLTEEYQALLKSIK